VRTTFETSRLAPPPEGSVVSVGVFDGVHLGHMAILAANVARARELGAQPAVVTFRRHPKKVLLGRAPKTLTTLEHRLELFSRAGIEHAVVLNFDEELRGLAPREFSQRYLVQGLGARLLVLGFDSKLGRDRQGTPDVLRALGHEVVVVSKVVVGERAVSSTAIREAVELGDLEGAARMLGRPVGVLGVVVHGDARGRELGFPTANLDLHHELHPPVGVYAARTRVLPASGFADRMEPHDSVVNIGFRPTVDRRGGEPPTVEVHLLDFEGDLYGRRMEVEFVAPLRGERRFPGLGALREQIAHDVEQARALLRGDAESG
jgi:riboflavin kinase/FMN adenylyltransferase